MSKVPIRFAAALAALALLAGCSGSPSSPGTPSANGSGTSSAKGTVKLVTHDSFQLSKGLLEDFQKETGYAVEVIAPGDGGELVNKLILTKNSPLGDVVYGLDNTFASRAVDEGVLVKYAPKGAAPGFETLGGHVTAIDQADVCLNVDHTWFKAKGLAEPATFEDLLKPEFKDLAVVTNPSTSSPGHAFLLATIAHFGEDGWKGYWKSLLANGLKISQGWSDAYYVDFSGAKGKGPRPIVLSYASSPAAEVKDGVAPTGSLQSTCFRQIEYAAVLAGAKNPEGAQALVDFLLTDKVQNDLPGSMYVYPVSPTAVLPPEWVKHASLATKPNTMEPAQITKNRDRWLKEWLELVG